MCFIISQNSDDTNNTNNNDDSSICIHANDCISQKKQLDKYMDVSKNRGIPKSSILIGFSIINHPFWGTAIFGNTHMTFPSIEVF